MANLAKLKERTAPASLDIDGERLNMRVRVHAITPAMERAIAEAQGKAEQVSLICEALCAYIAEWDLETEPGVMLPLTPEVIEQELPSVLLVAIFEKAREAVSPLGQS